MWGLGRINVRNLIFKYLKRLFSFLWVILCPHKGPLFRHFILVSLTLNFGPTKTSYHYRSLHCVYGYSVAYEEALYSSFKY